MNQIKQWTCDLVFRNPAVTTPPFDQPILVVTEGSVDRGDGFYAHHEIMMLEITRQDADGDGGEGAAMAKELGADPGKWATHQFRCVSASCGDELDFFSDSIVWWAPKPAIPKSK